MVRKKKTDSLGVTPSRNSVLASSPWIIWFFFSSTRRHTRSLCDWSSDVCSSDLGDGIFKGEADVVVCDGFVGNVMLKASEGMVQMVRSFIRQEFMRSVLARLAGVIVMPAIYAFRKRLDPRRFNGATLLGLRGIVVKSHGSADAFGFERAIERAMEEVRNEVLHRLMLRFGRAERGNSEAVET